jgi:serine phosphatase RsbU (regulator of sigma subunit)/rhodanese-related sulfurtransferase
MTNVKHISPAELQLLINVKANVRIIDVRSSTEYKEKHISIAEHFPIDKIEAGEFTASHEEIIVTACGSGGGRSERSAKMISEKFDRDVYYLEGGTFGWFKYEEQQQRSKETLFQKILKTGHLPTDSEDDKLKKTSLLIMSFPFALAGLVWGVLYFYNDLSLPGWIPFSYGVLSLLTVAHFFIWKKFGFFRFSQILLILLLPFFLQLSLGGFIASSAVIIWAIISPLGATVLYDVKRSVYWFVAFAILVVAACILNDFLPLYVNNQIPIGFINRLFLMNVLGVSLMIYFMQYYFVGKQRELKKAVEIQNEEIAEKNKSITDSINYAKRIQMTLLANDAFLKENLKDHFVLFKPKDIVSGDFCWATKRRNKFYLAVCDSTGHGVPGAFMSLLNISFLNEAINEKGIETPDEICNYVRQKLIESISQDGAKDGMDGILICWDDQAQKLTYAAGHNSPFLVIGNSGRELEVDKMPIGYGENLKNFKLGQIDVKSEERIYLYTDGYADQFGGPRGKKFKYKQLQELLVSLNNVSFTEQKKILDAIITEWKGNLEQTDDILVVGVKLV